MSVKETKNLYHVTDSIAKNIIVPINSIKNATDNSILLKVISYGEQIITSNNHINKYNLFRLVSIKKATIIKIIHNNQ